MGMTNAQIVLALGMLITGSLNTITTNFADNASAVGTMSPSTIWGKLNAETDAKHLFDHPFVQATIMFCGEFLCALAYVAQRGRGSSEPAAPSGGAREALFFWIPALCDMCGTGIMYAGLCLSYASIFQMLRGASIVFTAIISTFFLGRKQWAFQWFSVALVIGGIVVVGWVSLAGSKDSMTKPANTVLIGDALIIFAQLIVAIQMCVEEKIMSMYNTPALKAVGLEGMFGALTLGALLVPMYFIRIDGVPFENFPDAMAQMGNNWVIPLAMSGNMLSIAFFNFFGISVTKSMSAAHRMVLDSVRTVLVWACSLALGWEEFHALQLVGFVLLSLGTAMYNEIIRVPVVFNYPSQTTPKVADDMKEAMTAQTDP
jgi:uncharacterized membrane protein